MGKMAQENFVLSKNLPFFVSVLLTFGYIYLKVILELNYLKVHCISISSIYVGAITWMKENQGTTVDIFTFNVRRPEFNCFPSDEDKDKIETKVYTEKRYQACRKLKGQLM